jgi:hypothetical protein
MLGLGAALALVMGVTGCSAGKEAAGLPTPRVLESGTMAVLEEQGIEVAGDLSCTVDIGSGEITRNVTGACNGVDTDDNAVASTLDGRFSDARNNCTGTLVVTNADEVVAEVSDFDCDGK